MITFFGTSPVGSHLATALPMSAEQPFAAVSHGLARAYWPAHLLPFFWHNTCPLRTVPKNICFSLRSGVRSLIID
jgi:hypothetical protein